METISISIGDARSSTCIVLPRGHEIVKHLESLLPASSQPQPSFGYHQDSLAFQNQPPRMEMAPSLPLPAPTVGLPHVQQPHRSAALIQTLLHRPGSGSESESSSTRNPYRRGRVSTAAQGGSKRCQVPGCGKISVSRGVCRAHGGGRRCQYPECPKSAQSRGDYCWSHGGGHRCEVPGCMRSRKSKRFCKAHLNWGGATTPSGAAPQPVLRPRAAAPVPAPSDIPPAPAVVPPAVPVAPPAPCSLLPGRLPSLTQALQSQQDAVPRAMSPPAGYPAFRPVLSSSISC